MTSPSDKATRNLKPEFVERRRSARVPLAPLGEDARSANILTPLVFTTEELEPSAQFPAWQQHVTHLYDVRMPEDVSIEDGFAVTQKVWDLRGMLLVEQSVPPFSYERTAEKFVLAQSTTGRSAFAQRPHGRPWTAVWQKTSLA